MRSRLSNSIKPVLQQDQVKHSKNESLSLILILFSTTVHLDFIFFTLLSIFIIIQTPYSIHAPQPREINCISSYVTKSIPSVIIEH